MNSPGIFVLSFVVLLAACSGGEGPPGRGPIDDFPAAIAGAECRALFDGSADDGYTLRVMLHDVATCSARMTALQAWDYAPLLALVHAGRVRFDPDAAQRCLARISSERITDCYAPECVFEWNDLVWHSRERPCSEAFTGTVPLGGACSRSEECANDAYCDGRTDCLGTCRARTPLGGACSTSLTCQHAGLSGQSVCGRFEEGRGNACWDLVRTSTPASSMSPCGYVTQGTTATATSCQHGLYCNHYYRICAPVIAGGQPCTDSEVCAEGYRCNNGGATRGTCVEIVSSWTRGIGEACGGSSMGDCNPWDRLQCVDMHCVQYGDGTLGSRCDYYHPRTIRGCNPGLYCEPGSSTCVAAKQVGAACSQDDECASHGCSNATHRCVAQACL